MLFMMEIRWFSWFVLIVFCVLDISGLCVWWWLMRILVLWVVVSFSSFLLLVMEVVMGFLMRIGIVVLM